MPNPRRLCLTPIPEDPELAHRDTVYPVYAAGHDPLGELGSLIRLKQNNSSLSSVSETSLKRSSSLGRYSNIIPKLKNIYANTYVRLWQQGIRQKRKIYLELYTVLKPIDPKITIAKIKGYEIELLNNWKKFKEFEKSRGFPIKDSMIRLSDYSWSDYEKNPFTHDFTFFKDRDLSIYKSLNEVFSHPDFTPKYSEVYSIPRGTQTDDNNVADQREFPKSNDTNVTPRDKFKILSVNRIEEKAKLKKFKFDQDYSYALLCLTSAINLDFDVVIPLDMLTSEGKKKIFRTIVSLETIQYFNFNDKRANRLLRRRLHQLDKSYYVSAGS